MNSLQEMRGGGGGGGQHGEATGSEFTCPGFDLGPASTVKPALSNHVWAGL